MDLNTSPSQSKIPSIKIAKEWLSRGIQPTPLKPRSKKPSAGKGWNKLILKPSQLLDYFPRGHNVGGMWGAPSNWIVDVDLDIDEACKLAPAFLPETFIYGRRNRPGSHFVYRCKGIKTLKLRTKELETILEIRSTGTQSVLPGSIHPDGDYYEVEHDVKFSEIFEKNLTRQVKYLAAASIFLRRYPSEGGRHDYICAVTGALLREGWDRKKLRHFMVSILEASDDSDVEQRIRTVDNTIEHHNDSRTYGWNTLTTWIPDDEIRLIKEWVGALSSLKIVSSEMIVKENPKAPVKKGRTPFERFDTDWLNVPGVVGDLIKVADGAALTKQPLFNLASAIMAMAFITQNRYVVSRWDTPLQPYLMIVAPTGGGKESTLTSLRYILKQVGLGEYLFQGFQSFYAMLDTLAQPPNQGFWVWDEAGRKLKSGSSPSSADYQMLSHVISLYGKANDHVEKMPGRKNAIPALDHPFFLILAASQPQLLSDAITQGDVLSGLLNRFVLFDSGTHYPQTNEQRTTLFPAKLVDYAKRFKTITPQKGDGPFAKIHFEDDGSYDFFRSFEETCRQKMFYEDNQVWARANQNALIFAGTVAVGISQKSPKITLEIAKWATDVIKWSCECWEYRMSHLVSRNYNEAKSKLVEDLIRNVASSVRKGIYRPNQIKFMEKGVMPRTVLMKQARNLSSRELDEVIEGLVEMDLITALEADNGGGVFYKPKN